MSKCHFSFWLSTTDWHPGQKGLSWRPHEDTLQSESSAVILSFLATRHLQIKMSRCLACFLHHSCLPLENVVLCPHCCGNFHVTAAHGQSSAQCQRQSLLSIQSIKVKEQNWAALTVPHEKWQTLTHTTSFARCSSSSVNKLKKGLYCQWNIQTWIWLIAALIYLFICFGGRLSCLF